MEERDTISDPTYKTIEKTSQLERLCHKKNPREKGGQILTEIRSGKFV